VHATRVARNASAAAVATIAAWSSYSHMVHVALRYGERPEVACTLPVSVDGMLVVASVAMVDDRRERRQVRRTARIAFAIGVAASLAANVAAAHPSLPARAVAAWPAVALLLVVEVLARPGRTSDPRRGRRAERPTEPEPAGSTAAADTDNGGAQHERIRGRCRPTAVTRALALAILADEPTISRTALAARVGVSPRRLRAVLGPSS
jgi:hypothetical protein